MDTRVFCVFNSASRVFLSSKVTVADGASQPLKVLKVMVSGLALDAESGLWLTPINGIPAVPRLFPFDIAYLDQEHRVLETVEMLPGIDFPPHRREFASAVVLPLNRLRFTQTRRGDQLIVCLQQEAQGLLSGMEADPNSARVLEAMRPETTLPAATETAILPEPALSESTAKLPGTALTPTGAAPAAVQGGVMVADQTAVEQAPQQTSPADSSAKPGTSNDREIKAGEDVSATPVKPQSVSIREVVIEKPQVSQARPVTGHFGVEDLFANWVDSPSAPPSWIAQKTKAGLLGPPVQASESDPVSAPAPVHEPTATDAGSGEIGRTDGNAVAGFPAPEEPRATWGETESGSDQERASATQPTSGADRKSESSGTGKAARVPTRPEVKTPIPSAIPQPAQSTTFTFGQYGMWNVSTPTVAGPAPAAKGAKPSSAGKSAPSVNEPTTGRGEKTQREQSPGGYGKPASQIPPNQSKTTQETQPEHTEAPGKRVESGVVSASTEAGLTKPNKVAESLAQERPKAEVRLPGKSQPILSLDVSDWRTHRIIEATGKQVSPEFARAVEDKLAKLQTKAPHTPASKPVEKPEVALEKKLEAALGRKSEVVPVERTAPAVVEKQEAFAARTTNVVPPVHPTPTSIEKPAAATQKKPILAKTPPSPKETGSAAPVEAASKAKKPEVAGDSNDVGTPSFLKSKPEQKGKLKTSLQRADADGKNGRDADSFGAKVKRWLSPTPSAKSDRRRAQRRYVPGMVAHYYTGGAPKPHEVADISMTGFYLLTDDRWMPGTMIQMTLQKPCPKGERKQSITVLSRVIRRGSDGVAAEFVMSEGLDPHSRDLLPAQATDRFTLARFI